MKKPFKKFIKFLSIIILISGFYYLGYAVGHKNLVFEKNYQPKVLGISTDKPQDVDFSLFWNAWDLLKANFFGKLDTQKLVYGAISGMVGSTGDNYTLFMSPDEAKKFTEDLNGSFTGIGAEMAESNGHLVIVAPLEGSPAQKAGLRTQDIVLRIDDQDISGMTLAEAINKIRGQKDTIVMLSIYRVPTKENLDIKITRDIITVNSVKWEEKQGNLYIKISQFGDDTVKLMQQAAQVAIDKNYPGIIIDLRNNPGGYLEGAVDVGSLFLENGKTIVQEQNKDNSIKQFKTTLSPILKDKKLVVLIDGGSASASEILSGAMQDYGRAKLVGEKSFGKGSVQNLEDMKDGSKLKITIAKWLTPNGRQIDKIGISPDIEIKMSEDDFKNNRDPQLDKALELIK